MNKKNFGLVTTIIFLATCGKTYAEDMTLQQLMQSEFGAFSSSQRKLFIIHIQSLVKKNCNALEMKTGGSYE